jgi:hypothetical protein
MKNLFSPLSITLIICLIAINCILYADLQEQLALNHANSAPNHPEFIWNDDAESIPTEGSEIIIEHISEGIIYIGPKN